VDFDDASPRARPGDIMAQLSREDLERLSVSELDARVVLLEAEITRTRAQRDRSASHKTSAEALFRK